MEKTTANKKALPYALTTIGYVCIIVFLLMLVPVVLPPIFGYHTYAVAGDTTGQVGISGSVVYVRDMMTDELNPGNIIAYQTNELIANDKHSVNVAYVSGVEAGVVDLQDGTSTDADHLTGWIRAKTPYIGYLCSALFHVWGIILSIVIIIVGIVCTMCANKIRKNQNLNDLKAEIDEKKRKENLKQEKSTASNIKVE